MRSSQHWAAVVLSCAAFVSSAAIAGEPSYAGTSLHLGVGVMQPEADGRLTDQDGHVSFAAGANWRRSRYLAVELIVLETGQSAEMPRVERSGTAPPGSRQRAHINASGIAAGAKLIYPLGRLEPYVGAGFGYYVCDISSYGTLGHLFLPSDFAKRHDSGVGTHYMAGVDLALSDATALELEYRRLDLEASFGPEFGGPTRIGGAIVMVAFRWRLR